MAPGAKDASKARASERRSNISRNATYRAGGVEDGEAPNFKGHAPGKSAQRDPPGGTARELNYRSAIRDGRRYQPVGSVALDGRAAARRRAGAVNGLSRSVNPMG